MSFVGSQLKYVIQLSHPNYFLFLPPSPSSPLLSHQKYPVCVFLSRVLSVVRPMRAVLITNAMVIRAASCCVLKDRVDMHLTRFFKTLMDSHFPDHSTWHAISIQNLGANNSVQIEQLTCFFQVLYSEGPQILIFMLPVRVNGGFYMKLIHVIVSFSFISLNCFYIS